MRIYEIREIGGEWEDSYDTHHSAYLSKEKAEAALKELKEQLEKDYTQGLICEDCPFSWTLFENEEEFKAEKVKYPNRECIQKATMALDCYIDIYTIANNYYIKELDVIE